MLLSLGFIRVGSHRPHTITVGYEFTQDSSFWWYYGAQPRTEGSPPPQQFAADPVPFSVTAFSVHYRWHWSDPTCGSSIPAGGMTRSASPAGRQAHSASTDCMPDSSPPSTP